MQARYGVDGPRRLPVSLRSPVGGEGGGLLSHALGQGFKCFLSAHAKVEVFLPFPRQGSKYRLREVGYWTQGHTARLAGPGPPHLPTRSLSHPQLRSPLRLVQGVCTSSHCQEHDLQWSGLVEGLILETERSSRLLELSHPNSRGSKVTFRAGSLRF